jgi:hypothetical protein
LGHEHAPTPVEDTGAGNAGADAERGLQALAETDLHEVGPGRYEAFLPETWTALQGRFCEENALCPAIVRYQFD